MESAGVTQEAKQKVSLVVFYFVIYRWSLNGPFYIPACKGAAKVMYTATQAFGCKAYLDAQKKSCICVEAHERKEELWTLFV